MRSYTRAARARLMEPREECVLHVYDDKIPEWHDRDLEIDMMPILQLARGALV